MGWVVRLREEVSAGGVVFRRHPETGAPELLMILDRFGRWTLPKGHIEGGEGPAQAALREVFEETGLRGRIVDDLGCTVYTFNDGRGPVRKTVRYFLIQAADGALFPCQGEVADARWFAPEAITGLPQYDNNCPILDAAMRLLRPPISRLAAAIPPFLVMDVLERAREMERQGRSIVHLEVGEPDFPAPAPVRDAGALAIAQGLTGYTPSLGLPELREAIARRYQESCGVGVDPERVVVTTGTSAALNLILLALLDHGDEVIVSDPGYACYPTFIRAAGGQPVSFPLRQEDGFRPAPEVIAAATSRRTRAIIVNSPANPTGVVLSRQDWVNILAAAGKGVYVISDEIYHGLVYEGECPSALEFTDKAFVIGGFSKLYAMTGWRLGWCIVPPEFVRPLQKLQQNLYICPPAVAQAAGLAALTTARDATARAVEGMVAEYRRRRDLLLGRLRAMGLDPGYVPGGAYYVLVDTRHIDPDSYRLAGDILEQAGVAITPGIDFGHRAEGFLRISYAASTDSLAEGLSRLERYLAARLGR